MIHTLLTSFQNNCAVLLEKLPKSHSRACFRSALYHLDKAKLLETIDPAMAIFRAITAEEEAASGLMYCLREGGYVNSNKLNPRNHVHKHAMIPFLRVIGLFHGQVFGGKINEYRLQIQEENGQNRLMLTFPVTINSHEIWGYSVPPLNFGVKDGATSKPPSYEAQIVSFVESMGAKSILTYLRKESNLRNQVLYAASDGYPVISELKPEFLAEKAAHVSKLLQVYLLIKPWSEIQPYVQDSIGAFLAMVGAIESVSELANSG